MKTRSFLPLTFAASLLVSHSGAGAAVVTTCDDAGLRAAIASGGSVTFGCDGTIVLTNTIEITNNVTVDGSGRSVVISGGGSNRVFTLRGGASIGLANLLIANGAAATGGGLLNVGSTLLMTNVCFSNNIAGWGSLTSTVAAGGAIFNSAGFVLATNCMFLTNTASAVGGARGGAWFNASTAKLYSCTFDNNRTFGAVALNYGTNAGSSALGGAICNVSSLLAARTIFLRNSTVGGRGDSGFPGGVVGAAGGNSLGGAIYNSGTAGVLECMLSSNVARGGGGGDGRTGGAGGPGTDGEVGWRGGAGMGGAIASDGSLAVVATLLRQNIASGGNGGAGGHGNSGWGDGGAGGGAGSGSGGAIYVGTGEANITNSTLALNQASGGGGGAGGYAGQGPPIGGISIGGSGGDGGDAFGGAIFQSNTLVNCSFITIASNSASGGFGGNGGISACGVNCNAPPGKRGNAAGTSLANTGSVNALRLHGAIIHSGSTNANVVGAIQDGGYNLCSDGTAAFTSATSLNNVDPKLAALTNNGGFTWTMALLDNSPAIDRVPPSSAPTNDQRGVPRPLGLQADSGAVERNSSLRLTIQKTNGLTAVSFPGEAGRAYRLQRSDSFSNWTGVFTNTPLSNTMFRFEDQSTAQRSFIAS